MNQSEDKGHSTKGSAKEIRIKELMSVIKKRLWIIAVAVVISAIGGYAYSVYFKAKPMYQSSMRLLITTESNNMNTLMVMIKDPNVLETVSDKLSHLRSPNVLNNEIETENIDQSQIVLITVTDSNPDMAARIANTTANVFKDKAETILNFKKVQILTEAKVNPAPINPSNNHKDLYFILFGLIVGVGMVFLLNALDDTVQTEDELEKLLEAPMLGNVSKMTKKNTRTIRKQPFNDKTILNVTNLDVKKEATVQRKNIANR
ncbi:YveK family protein [Camelliibacillus cellulosilyticus]|uniref:YveK family protein n=1 Tax=Camelliibacillus cellulosilyticus TaxID=2174486 RepID=A0ABV9GPD7_9BACL